MDFSIFESLFNKYSMPNPFFFFKQFNVYYQYPNGSTSVYDLLGNNVDWNENW